MNIKHLISILLAKQIFYFNAGKNKLRLTCGISIERDSLPCEVARTILLLNRCLFTVNK